MPQFDGRESNLRHWHVFDRILGRAEMPVPWDLIFLTWENNMICGNHYKVSKIHIILSIEYLKARILFEIRIFPQARSIMSSLNDSC